MKNILLQRPIMSMEEIIHMNYVLLLYINANRYTATDFDR